jgi:hypothetical protein
MRLVSSASRCEPLRLHTQRQRVQQHANTRRIHHQCCSRPMLSSASSCGTPVSWSAGKGIRLLASSRGLVLGRVAGAGTDIGPRTGAATPAGTGTGAEAVARGGAVVGVGVGHYSSYSGAAPPPRLFRRLPCKPRQLTSPFLRSPSSHPDPGCRYLSTLHPSRLNFSTSIAKMGATKLDGTAIAKTIRERLGAEIAEKQKQNPRYKPSLKILQG